MIRVENVSKNYGKAVLGDVTFTVDEGEIIGIYGASGQGKTTLLNLLMGLEQCDSGEISGINGKMAAVFQEDRLFENLNAVDNIRFVSDCSRELIGEELHFIIPDLNLKKKVKELSGGMKRRVCIVRAMITNADYIFMDEPFKGLDEKNKEMTIEYVLDHKGKSTIFIVTHDRTELELMGVSKIIRLKEKRD